MFVVAWMFFWVELTGFSHLWLFTVVLIVVVVVVVVVDLFQGGPPFCWTLIFNPLSWKVGTKILK